MAAYQLGYGVAAFGAGALQTEIALTTVFWLAVLLAAVMAVLAFRIVRIERRPVGVGP